MKRATVRALTFGTALLVVAGCRITPEEIQVIEAENDLLREEISQIKEKCDQSRELELRVDEEEAP